MQEQKPQPTVQADQELTPQTVQQFNKVCKQATELMLSYKNQSQELKNEITSMVTIYNKTANPNDAVPVQKIMQITNVYETQMRNAHNEYESLQKELRKEEAERNDMIKQIQLCFGKLEKMEQILKERKAKQSQAQQKKEIEGSAKKEEQSKN